MRIDILPLLCALRRNPTGAVLVVLQIAITLAVLVNAAWIVSQRIAQIEQPTGLDTPDTFGMIVGAASSEFNVQQAEAEDLAYLRSLPGVAAAALTGGIPLTSQGAMGTTLWPRPGRGGEADGTNFLNASGNLLQTLDVPLIAGRDFRPDEIRTPVPGKGAQPPAEIILTQALAQALFPGENALGRAVYTADSYPLTVVGITRNFMDAVGVSGGPLYHAALIPFAPGQRSYYALLVRAQPGRRDAVLRAARQHIGASHPDGVIGALETFSSAKRAFDADDRNMAVLLAVVTALLVIVCCLGIFGLATFNVGTRTRQIGTRRAVGARRRDVVTHFLVENAIILAAGTLLGSLLGLAVGDWLSARYGLPRLDLAYLAGGIAALWVVGQLAAWQPARKAATVPPSVATRTV